MCLDHVKHQKRPTREKNLKLTAKDLLNLNKIPLHISALMNCSIIVMCHINSIVVETNLYAKLSKKKTKQFYLRF